MTINYISSRVRIIAYGSPDYLVRVEGFDEGMWCTYWETNEMSNDFAYTEAHDKARALAKELDLRDNYGRKEV